MKVRKVPVEVEAWTVRDLNRCAAHDWQALPQAVRDDYENPQGQGAWVFGALIETATCSVNDDHAVGDKAKFCGECGAAVEVHSRRGVYVPTLEGNLFAAPDDLIIRGVAGEFYPIKPLIFAGTYEVLDV